MLKKNRILRLEQDALDNSPAPPVLIRMIDSPEALAAAKAELATMPPDTLFVRIQVVCRRGCPDDLNCKGDRGCRLVEVLCD